MQFEHGQAICPASREEHGRKVNMVPLFRLLPIDPFLRNSVSVSVTETSLCLEMSTFSYSCCFQVQDEYVDTVSKMFFSYFKAYITRLFKLLVSFLHSHSLSLH